MSQFLSSDSMAWGVLDTWLYQSHALGVFTVLTDHARGEDWLVRVKGNHQGSWALAVVDQAAREPADRLRQALDQSSQRGQTERLGGSMQPVQVWPPSDTAAQEATRVKDDQAIRGERDFLEDHWEEMHPVPRYGQDRHGQGRWVSLYRFGQPIGTLWTDDAQALGFIPAPGVSVALLVNSIGSACRLGTPTAWVFDDHAAWASQADWAGPVERGDLATLGSEWAAVQ